MFLRSCVTKLTGWSPGHTGGREGEEENEKENENDFVFDVFSEGDGEG